MVAAADRQLRDGHEVVAGATYRQAAELQAEIVSGLAPGRQLDTLTCACVLLYRRAGALVEARQRAERFLELPLAEPAEGWLLDQVSELTMGSYVPDPEPERGRSAMGELVRLRRRVS